MADDLNAAQPVKITGQSAAGAETNPVDATTLGLKTDVQASVLPTGAATLSAQTTMTAAVQETHGTVAAGTAATKSGLIGGVYNSTLPALTTGQQSAIQTDSSGRLLVSGSATVSLANFFYDDMNVANGGIARGTALVNGTATTIYSHTGAGSIYGFIINVGGLPATPYLIDLVIDGNHQFGASGISTADLFVNTVYDISVAAADISGFLGFSLTDKSIRWSVPGGGQVQYATSVVLKVTKVSGGGANFNAGLIALTR